MAITSAATVVGALTQLALISPQLTILVLAVAPPVAFVASFASRYDRKLRRRANEAHTASTVSAGEAFSKLPTVQAYAQEELQPSLYLQEAIADPQRCGLLFAGTLRRSGRRRGTVRCSTRRAASSATT